MRASNGNETELTEAVLDGVTGGGGFWDTIVEGLKTIFGGGGESPSGPIVGSQCPPIYMGNTSSPKPKPAPAPKKK
jgi:hypothetical protein